jgi:hypothetical protein
MNDDGPERPCQGVSAKDERCDYPATVHCPACGRWFCDAHSEEIDWHSCLSQSKEDNGAT